MAGKGDVKRERYLTPAVVAEILSCSERHVYELIGRGGLVAIKIGSRAIRISEQALHDFIASNRFNPEDLYDPDREEQVADAPQRQAVKSMWMTK